MFESLVNGRRALEQPWVVFFFGLLFTLISFAGAFVALREEISLLMLFFWTLLTVPLLMEVLLRSEGEFRATHPFFEVHRRVIEVYVLLFFGLFVGYVLLSFLLPPTLASEVFSFQQEYVLNTKGLSLETFESFLEGLPPISLEQTLAILSKNLFLALLAFGLSFLYGASSMFLVVLNGSVFATFLVEMIKLIATTKEQAIKIVLLFSIHLIPEVTGFLIAAIAGGLLSQAVLSKKWKKAIARDAFKLFALSICCIVLAAILEVYVSTRLFHSLF
ncbi:hypothetical protein D6774_02965 [Candidatus Woesearchaeota archaeon]|nr:MAG: hypothetical protein D6774_02965 [Candidatus Woesearchaeota archaeon]